MKRLSGILLLLVIYSLSFFAQNVTRAEYFIDTDPGTGNGTAVNFSGTDPVTGTFNLDLNNVSVGHHKLGLRVRSNKGAWGISMYRYFYVFDTSSYKIPKLPVLQINKAEYIIDNELAQGAGTSIDINPDTVITKSFSFNVHPLQVGFHSLSLRVRNSRGIWSEAMNSRFYVYDTMRNKIPKPSNFMLNTAEYFIDNDLKQGSGIQQSFPADSGVNMSFSFNIHPLAKGFHILGLRVRNTKGIWSEAFNSRFYVYDTMYSHISAPNPPQLKAAEYYFDNDAGQGLGSAIPVTPGAGLNINYSIGLAEMHAGFHRIGVRTKNENGMWSNAMNSLFYVYDTALNRIPALATPQLSAAEYFFDTDAGQGSGIPVTLNPSANLNVQTSVSVLGIEPGFHRLGFRTKNDNGLWSNSKVSLFYIYDSTYFSLAKGTSIIGGEYYFDNDSLPAGEGTPIVIPKSESLSFNSDIPVSTLDTGVHTIYVRVQNENLKWSRAAKTRFSISNWDITSNSPICFSYNNGIATVSVKQGRAPFLFLWSDYKHQAAPSATNLAPGKYKVAVTDGNKFVFTDSITIVQADSMHLDIVKNDAQCSVSNGFASVLVTGDYPPYSYEWSTGLSEPTISELPAGLYYITVTDEMGCKNNTVASINDIGGPEILLHSIKDVKCHGGNNGQINLLVTGGVAPYRFKWSNGATSQDIWNLTAGAYEVTVTDTNGCSASRQFFISEPDPLRASISVQKADCGMANGSGTVYVTGGIAPYIYAWQGGGSSATRSNLALGVYKVYISDSKNCTLVASVGVGEKNAPLAQVTGIQQATCGMKDGAIYISAGNNDSIYQYSWSCGVTTRNLIGVTPGSYTLTVTDTMNCRMIVEATIPVEKPNVNPICLVTVDSTSKANLVVWSKLYHTGIDHYNVYRESSRFGEYIYLGSVSADLPGLFIDSLSDPSMKPYSYKLGVVDSCGILSDLSSYHKTIHLTMNIGLGGSVNLIWNKYEGFDVSTYNVWRFTSTTGWTVLDKLSSDITSFTDHNATSDATYYIEAEYPEGCDISGRKSKTLNSTRSNRTSRGKSGTTVIEGTIFAPGMEVYPNPSRGEFTLTIYSESEQEILIRLIDSKGSVIDIQQKEVTSGKNVFEWRLSNYKPGLYSIIGIQKKRVSVAKIIML